MFDERILPYLPQGGNQGFREALAPAGTYAPSFTDTYFINLTLGALRTIAWCIVAGACRPKQLSPPMGFKTYRCVFIKALQSKVFSEILLICVNFLVTAHGSICFPRQNAYFLFQDIRHIIGCFLLLVWEVLVSDINSMERFLKIIR